MGLESLLFEWEERHGVATIGALGLRELEASGFSDAVFERLSSDAEVLRFDEDSLSTRSAPWRLFPWAKSVFIAAIPFDTLPFPRRFPPSPEGAGGLAGLVAGYATRLDYHKGGAAIMEDLADALTEVAGAFRAAVTVDSARVAEKSLAMAARLGRIGGDSLLRVGESGDTGCFLAELFVDFTLPPSVRASVSPLEWGRNDVPPSVARCPVDAISGDGRINIGRCVSYLNTMKRGWLEPEERRKMGRWLFGCDVCSSFSAGEEFPKSVSVDLEWLLSASSAEVAQSIADTPMAHAGVTMLRRNALAVLENIGGSNAERLVERFANATGSQLLRQMAEDVLEGSLRVL